METITKEAMDLILYLAEKVNERGEYETIRNDEKIIKKARKIVKKNMKPAAKQFVTNLEIWKEIKRINWQPYVHDPSKAFHFTRFVKKLFRGYNIPINTDYIFQSKSNLGSGKETRFNKIVSKENCQNDIIRIVSLSTAELGFPVGARVEEIKKQAKEFGLEFIPQEFIVWFLFYHHESTDDKRVFVTAEGDNYQIGGDPNHDKYLDPYWSSFYPPSCILLFCKH